MSFNGKRMRAKRRNLDLTLKQLGELIDVDYQRLQEYESGKAEPKADRLGQIAEALETNVYYLLDRTDYPNQLTELHYQVWDAFDSGDSNRIIDLLRQHLVKKGIGKKPMSGRKPGAAKKLLLSR